MKPLILDVALALCWLGSGFMWGRLYELKFGMYKKAYQDAMNGWKGALETMESMAKHLGIELKNVPPMPEIDSDTGLQKSTRPDGLVKSPFGKWF